MCVKNGSLMPTHHRVFFHYLFLCFFFSPPQESGEVRPTRFLPRVRWVGLKAGKYSSLFQPLKQNKRLCLSSRSGTWVTFGSQISDEVRAVFSLCVCVSRRFRAHTCSYCFCGKHLAAGTQISDCFPIIEQRKSDRPWNYSGLLKYCLFL